MADVFNAITSQISGKVRRVLRNGKEWWVLPLTSIVPGVLEGSDGPGYYSPEQTKNSTKDWDYMPIVAYHPNEVGEFATGSNKNTLNKTGIGLLRRSTFNDKLQHEAWVDPERVRKVDSTLPDHAKLEPRIRNGQPIEGSTGLRLSKRVAGPNSTYNGKAFTWIAENFRPDHMAILPDQVGACSVNDGCGFHVNQKWEFVTNKEITQAQKDCLNWAFGQEWIKEYEEDNKEVTSNSSHSRSIFKRIWDGVGELVWNQKHFESGQFLHRGIQPGTKQTQRGAELGFADTDVPYEEGSENDLELTDDNPLEPERSTELKPIEPATNSTSSLGDDMGLTAEQRKGVVTFLVTNCECYKNKEKVLTNKDLFSDDDLLKLKNNYEQNKVTANTLQAFVTNAKDLGNGQKVIVFNEKCSCGGAMNSSGKCVECGKVMNAFPPAPPAKEEEEEVVDPEKKKVPPAPPAPPATANKKVKLEDMLSDEDKVLWNRFKSSQKDQSTQVSNRLKQVHEQLPANDPRKGIVANALKSNSVEQMQNILTLLGMPVNQVLNVGFEQQSFHGGGFTQDDVNNDVTNAQGDAEDMLDIPTLNFDEIASDRIKAYNGTGGGVKASA